MRYVGTRGCGGASFRDVVGGGLAPDGGLWVPERWPQFTQDDIAAMAELTYAETAAQVLARFVGDDIDCDTLRELCASAYDGFDDPAVTPLRSIDQHLCLLELFHGPTLSFKDIALQLIGRMLGHFGTRTTIIGATSGDTGSAALHAVAGRAGVRIVMLYPAGRISAVQRRQMTSLAADNVDVVAIDGSFDDCQRIVKALLGDGALVAAHRLSAVNSINWLRIAAQSVYYFYAAVRLGAPEHAVGFAVPTGNLGDAFAGHAARRMGLPIDRIIVATNANDIVARALQTAIYRPGAATATDAPAMDIQVASNFERLLWDAGGGDAALVARQMAALASEGAIILNNAQRAALTATTGIAIDAEAMDAAMRWADKRGLSIDPHTAIALAAAQLVGGDRPKVVLATAHPAKFPYAVRRATGRNPEIPERLANALIGPERVTRLPAEVDAVAAFVAARA